MARRNLLTAKEAARELGISIPALHNLCRPTETKPLYKCLKSCFYGSDRMIEIKDLEAWKANPEYQARRRPSHRQAQNPAHSTQNAGDGHQTSVEDTSHAGPLPGGNVETSGTVIARIGLSLPEGCTAVVERDENGFPIISKLGVPKAASTYVTHGDQFADPSTGHAVETAPALNASLAEFLRSNPGASARDIALWRLGKLEKRAEARPVTTAVILEDLDGLDPEQFEHQRDEMERLREIAS